MIFRQPPIGGVSSPAATPANADATPFFAATPPSRRRLSVSRLRPLLLRHCQLPPKDMRAEYLIGDGYHATMPTPLPLPPPLMILPTTRLTINYMLPAI